MLAKDGILLLAPTGKARVRLGKATNAEAMTVAQFLHRLGRYDVARQRPKFDGKEKSRKEKTVVIDACSMLTMDDLVAVLEALDLAHVQRLILAGDPNQRWQILSPVRMHPHGVHDLNRWVQRQFRSKELETASNPWGLSLGDESIVIKDKVIQTSNQWRDAYDGKSSDKHYLANGEVGLLATGKNGWMNVVFAGRPGLTRPSVYRSGAMASEDVCERDVRVWIR